MIVFFFKLYLFFIYFLFIFLPITMCCLELIPNYYYFFFHSVVSIRQIVKNYIFNCISLIIIIIIFRLKHQYLKHKYQSMVKQIIANMLSETVYTGITNLYIITKNQQNTKQYIINVNSVFEEHSF